MLFRKNPRTATLLCIDLAAYMTTKDLLEISDYFRGQHTLRLSGAIDQKAA